jgi:hypothetical protein
VLLLGQLHGSLRLLLGTYDMRAERKLFRPSWSPLLPLQRKQRGYESLILPGIQKRCNCTCMCVYMPAMSGGYLQV